MDFNAVYTLDLAMNNTCAGMNFTHLN